MRSEKKRNRYKDSIRTVVNSPMIVIGALNVIDENVIESETVYLSRDLNNRWTIIIHYTYLSCCTGILTIWSNNSCETARQC